MDRLPDANSIVKMWLLKIGHKPGFIRTDPVNKVVRIVWDPEAWWVFTHIYDDKLFVNDRCRSLVLLAPEDPAFFDHLAEKYAQLKEISKAYCFLASMHKGLVTARIDHNISDESLRRLRRG